jgi:thiol:disulfide interchange protein DsbC
MFGKVINITPPPTEEKEEEEGSGCLASGISKSKIKSVLSSLFGTDINIVEVNDTPISSIYEVIVRDPSGKTGILYMDCDLKHLILGSLLDIEGGKNLTAEKQKELAKNYYEQKEKELIAKLGEKKFKELKKVLNNFVYQLDIIDLNNVKIPKEGVIVYGNPNAKYTIYIISDPQCPFCAKLHDTIKKIVAKRKDVKFEIFMFPLSFHQYAKGISENILCQDTNEKRKEILDKSFEAVKNRNSEQLNKLQGACPTGSQVLAEHQQFAKDVNLRGTPLIIFPNGIAISGAVSEDILNKMINILSK